MTIQSDLQDLSDSLTDAYEQISEKGGTIPEDENAVNLPEAISSINSETEWGEITGTLSDQTDLQEVLDTIPELLTSTGQSTTAGMTQKAITDALAGAGGGGVKVLTEDDYNWPTSNPDGVALWLLETGIYVSPADRSIKVYQDRVNSSTSYTGVYIIEDNGYQTAYINIEGAKAGISYKAVNKSDGSARQSFSALAPVDSLTSSVGTSPLSANQGKVLKDLIDSLIIKGTGAPTTSTVGTVGKLYEDTTNGKLYQCTAVSGSTYTWTEVGGGGGGGTLYSGTGQNTDGAMTQKAVTDLVYQDNSSSKLRIGNTNNMTQSGTSIGAGSYVNGYNGLAIAGDTGTYAQSPFSVAIQGGRANGTNSLAILNGTADGEGAISIGQHSSSVQGASGKGSIALGYGANATQAGEFNVGTNSTDHGYNNTNYRLLTGLHDPVNDHDAATKGYVDSNSGASWGDITGTLSDQEDLQEALDDKVDKVSGKGLSTEDFTTEEKDKLLTIESGAEANVQSDWNAVSGDALILNKPTIPSKTSDLTNDSNFSTTTYVDSQISEINDLIPTEATTSNQLADKAFVNSSIATQTSNFKGTFNSISELPTTGVTINDYAFVISTDSAGNTVYNRYKYTSTGWQFEYALNNSSFTAAQWSTINSGLASSDKTKLDGIEAGAQKNATGTVVDANYVHTDNNFTTAEKSKLSSLPTTVPAKDEWYGTCSTAASTAAKSVTTQTRDFNLTTGSVVYVKMTYGNSASSATLNVDSKGAKTIYAYGTTSAQYFWNAGEVVGFVYDGTRFMMIGKNIAGTTYYGVTKLSSAIDSTSEALAATPKAVKQVADGLSTLNTTVSTMQATIESVAEVAADAFTLATSKPTIEMTTTDPGEGSTLAANHFIAVYE